MKKLLTLLLVLAMLCACGFAAIPVLAEYEGPDDVLVTDFNGNGALQSRCYPVSEQAKVIDGQLRLGACDWFTMDVWTDCTEPTYSDEYEAANDIFPTFTRDYEYVVYVLRFEGGATLNKIYTKNWDMTKDFGLGPGRNVPLQRALGYLRTPEPWENPEDIDPTDDAGIAPEVYCTYAFPKGLGVKMVSIEFERWNEVVLDGDGENWVTIPAQGYVWVDEIYLTNNPPANNKLAEKRGATTTSSAATTTAATTTLATTTGTTVPPPTGDAGIASVMGLALVCAGTLVTVSRRKKK